MKNRRKLPALAAAFLLAVLSFGGCLKIEQIQKPADPVPSDPIPAAPAETEPPETLPPEEIMIDEELLADAVALGIAGNSADYIEDADGLWNVIGWYAALNDRVSGTDGPWLSDGTCDALVSILRPDKDPLPIPERWMSGGTSRQTREGRSGILFTDYETLLNETLGIWREISQTVEDGTRIVAVTDHLEEGTERFLVYVAFDGPEDAELRRMVYLTVTDPIVEKELNFTLEDVREQNRISKLLTAYTGVTVDMSDEYGTAYQSFWLRDGDRVYYEADETEWTDEEGNPSVYHSENGSYRGISFNTYLAAEPMAFLWITAKPEDHTDEEYYENYISDYLPAAESVTEGPVYLLDTEDDISFRVTENYQPEVGPAFEITHIVTVDKGTLAVRQYRMEYVQPDGSEYAGGFSVSYNGEKLGEEVMKAWDACRTVTLDIKTEAGGERSETVKVPDGWFLNLLADEGVTVYADAALTEMTYNYIESGTGDITLYARDEANTAAAKVDPSSVTLENVTAANYLTSLIKRYGQVKVHTDNQYLTDDACYFRGGTSVAHLSVWQSADGSASGTTGSDGVLSYQINEDGSVTAYVYPSFNEENYRHDDYVDRNTDGDGEYYEGNTLLYEKLLGGTLDELAETDAGYTFRVTVAGNNPGVYRCTADKVTLALKEVRDESGVYALAMEYGEGLTPFAAEYADAMKKTRTLRYHAVSFAHTYDYVYTVPADWSFYLGASGMKFYANADFTGEVENLVPSDGKDHEYWVTDGTHTLLDPGLPFTMEQFAAANSISALIEKYGQVFIRITYDDGSVTNETEFFRMGDTPVMHETLQNPNLTEPRQSAVIGNDSRYEVWCEIGSDGLTGARLRINEMTADGSREARYRFDDFLAGNIGSAEPELVSETADTVTFSVPPAEYYGSSDEPPLLVFTVERETLTILGLKTPGERYEVVCGQNAASFSSVYAEAMADSRTVTCHYLTAGETKDIVWKIPSAWEAEVVPTVYIDGGSPFFSSSKEMNQPCSSVIPAYSGDVEIWCTVALG